MIGRMDIENEKNYLEEVIIFFLDMKIARKIMRRHDKWKKYENSYNLTEEKKVGSISIILPFPFYYLKK